MNAETKCPMHSGNPDGAAVLFEMSNRMWWPNQLDLSVLHQNSPARNPLGETFDYAAQFQRLDLAEVKQALIALMTDSQSWWPADFGHYGPLFVRMAWHSAGTYRIGDGRGGAGAGAQRFAPLNSWPDNANLDKARLLLWPIKQKYGRQLSWGDLLVLAGNCALESMGFKTAGFGGGRIDAWESPRDVNWGPEREWLGDERYAGERDLAKPLAAVQMGLIYVNPEGPNGDPDPLKAAIDIRETFARMAMNDAETVALIAGGHTFGKTHGAGAPDKYIAPEPEGAPIEMQGLGWANSLGSGNAGDTITSGLEGIWTNKPTTWDNGFFANLFEHEWELTTSPAGARQWVAKDAVADVPDAHDPSIKHRPTMLTTDLSLRVDPIYGPISRRFYENPDVFAQVFAESWYKLTHRDMGPHNRLLGPEVPLEPRLWQDPVPQAREPLIGLAEIDELKQILLKSGLSSSELIKTAWAAASSFRGSDKRGGANGARIRLAPQKDWAVNEPDALQHVLTRLAAIAAAFNSAHERQVSLADLIVLGGSVAVEAAAARAGHVVAVGFTPGRGDADEAQTDAASFEPLEPKTDPFRNYSGEETPYAPEELMVNRAHLLMLTVPEMTALVGGLRVLGANHSDSDLGVFTTRKGTLSNDFFRNLLKTSFTARWQAKEDGSYSAYDRETGAEVWRASRVDLIFGAHAELRAVAESYGSDDGEKLFIESFAAAWTKVMELDRFDLHR